MQIHTIYDKKFILIQSKSDLIRWWKSLRCFDTKNSKPLLFQLSNLTEMENTNFSRKVNDYMKLCRYGSICFINYLFILGIVFLYFYRGHSIYDVTWSIIGIFLFLAISTTLFTHTIHHIYQRIMLLRISNSILNRFYNKLLQETFTR